MQSVQVGEQAPDFTLTAHDGQPVSLADLRGRKLVLFFYPKDEAPVGTKEACLFREAYEDFVAADAEVMGISTDERDSHRVFAEGHDLPYKLLTDEDALVRKRFGVPKTLGVMPGRVTYVIDRKGVVRHITDSQLFAERHVEEALEAVRALI